MKKVIIFLCLMGLFAISKAQFNPGAHISINDALGQAQSAPIEGRGMFWDAVNFKWRDFQSTAEVLSTLPTNATRFSHFPIWVHVGGTLSGGVWTGGISIAYFFKDGLANGNLVRWYTDSTSGCSNCLLIANNLSDLANAGTARTNLGLGNVDNTSDATKNSASVTITNHIFSGANNTFSNLPNSALTNNSIGLNATSNAGSDISVTTTPAALGASLVINFPSSGTGTRGPLTAADWNTFNNKQSPITLTVVGTSGPATFSGSVLNIPQYSAGTGCINCNADSLKSLPVDTSSNRDGYILAFDSVAHKWYLTPNAGSGSGITQLTGDGTAGPGSGSQALTLATVNTNVGTFGSASTVYQGTINGKGLTTAGSSIAIQIAESQVTNLVTDLAAKQTTTLTSGNILMGNGSNVATSVTPSGDWTINNAGVNVIGANKITYAKFQAAAGQGLMGATGAANFGLITLGTNLSMSGSVLNANGGVNSVSNSDGTLTISPTTGAVVASMALGHANTWSALQTFGTLTTTGVTKFTGITSGASTDSILRINPSTGQITWSSGLPFTLFAVQGLKAYGTSGDSVGLGGSFFQADTIATNGFSFLITGLPNKTYGSTDSSVIEDATGKLFKVALPSLTTTGTSGAATFSPATGVLNIPQYQPAGTYLTQLFSKGGGVNILGTDTINADTTRILSTPTATIDSIFQRDTYTWQTSISSPLADSTTVGYRQDAPSVARLRNGHLFMAWSAFYTTGVADNSPSRIYGDTSIDNGQTWATPFLIVSNTVSNINHVSTPSIYIQNNGNIVMYVNVKNLYSSAQQPVAPNIGTNFYRYTSTGNLTSFTLQDSVYSVVSNYQGATNGRFVKSLKTGRVFLPFAQQTSISGHYRGRYIYSDDDANTFTLSSNVVTPTDTACNEPGIFIVQNKAPNDTVASGERWVFYWTNTISPTQIMCVQSTDNGATLSIPIQLGFPAPPAVVSLISINSETEVVGLTNRYLVSTLSTQAQQRKWMDIIRSIDGGNTWTREVNIYGPEAGYHYFEPSLFNDSATGNLLAVVSRMNDPQSRSDVRFTKIPARTVINPYSYPITNLIIGARFNQLSNFDASLFQIYNAELDNPLNNPVSAYINIGSASGGKTLWPYFNTKATPDATLGMLMETKIGSDVNAAYYSAGLSLNVMTNAGGTVANMPLFKVNNNQGLKFVINANGNVGINTTASTSILTLAANSTAGAAIKFTAGTPSTALSDGQINYNTGLMMLDSSASVRDTLATRSWTRNNFSGAGSGVTAVGSFSGSSQTNGASISTNTITFGPPSTTNPGMGFSGTYTPTFTNTTNISSSGLTTASYVRMGNVVTVRVSGVVTATLISTGSILTISLPITTASTSQGGVGAGCIISSTPTVNSMYGSITGGTTMNLTFTSLDTSSDSFVITFQYIL